MNDHFEVNRNIKIAMGQLLVEGGEPERNFKRAEKLIQQASHQECHLILLPECMDLAWLHPSALTNAQSIPGQFSNTLCQFAKENHIYICAGLTEREGSQIYNSAILINNQGNIILKYRKINELACAQHLYAIGY